MQTANRGRPTESLLQPRGWLGHKDKEMMVSFHATGYGAHYGHSIWDMQEKLL